MIVDLSTAQTIDSNLNKEQLLGLEKNIMSFTNNHFHLPNYAPRIKHIEHGKIYFEGANYFKVDDTVELYKVPYIEGFYHVDEVGHDYILINGLRVDTILENELNRYSSLYLMDYPTDVVEGAKKVLKYAHKSQGNEGIKSKSISRVSITYYNPGEDQHTILGMPGHVFDFLQPHIRLGD